MLTAMMMPMACHSDDHELADGVIDDRGLVARPASARMPSGRSVTGVIDLLLYVAAERQDVAAVAHGDGKPDGGLAVTRNIGCGGSA